MKAFADNVITRLGLDGVDQIVPLQQLCKKLQISRPAYLVTAGLVLSVVMILFSLAERIITNLICMLYPAYMSVKAIETIGDNDDKQWLTYWIVFSITIAADSTFGYFLGMIPFYYLIKLIFLVYLFHPEHHGASKIYEIVILPLYKKYGTLIDSKLGQYETLANDKIRQAKAF